ncbi:MAG: serine/threonine protein kinase [Arenimonas sp.]
MELDELKIAWQNLDRRLEAHMAMNQQELLKEKISKSHRKLSTLKWGQAIQMIAGSVIALMAIAFWNANQNIPHLFYAGLSLHIYGVALIIFGGVMQGLMSRIDYSAPVLEIQKQLAKTRRVYVIVSSSLGLIWWLLWIPLMMLFFAWAFGADIYTNAPGMILSWLATGVAGLLGSLGFMLWASKRPGLSEKLERSAAGNSLNQAQKFLDEIAQFEKP